MCITNNIMPPPNPSMLSMPMLEDAGGVLRKIWLMVFARVASFFTLCSVPSFMTEWYWKRLMEGTPQFVEFHNRVYGCSGVMPDKFPCTGPNFTWAMNSLYIFILPSLLFLHCVALRPLAIHKTGVHGLLLSNPKFECGWTTGVRTGWYVARLVKDNKRPWNKTTFALFNQPAIVLPLPSLYMLFQTIM